MNERIEIEKKVLSENDLKAAEIRELLAKNNVACINMVSSPGSGKTSLLERTLTNLGREFSIAVIVGDVQTDNDAKRIESAGGTNVKPIITGGACHLDARMVSKAIADLSLNDIDLLIIENVGNLVCPSSYDLGEDLKVVLISTTEGDDKPLKYPAMFRRSSIMVVNKIDLLGTSDFVLSQVKENALNINGKLKILELSCRTGEGLNLWYDWLRRLVGTSNK